MTYLDTDVWIHAFVLQDQYKHEQSRKMLRKYDKEASVLSTLNLQEILFVLAKLEMPSSEIISISEKLFQFNIVNYTLKEIERASFLAKDLGFRNINDCIHTAIAEKYCTELVTYNKNDFRTLKTLTPITITIL